MNILIVGAGIAGTALANNLQNEGFSIDIIEKAKSFSSNSGYVIGVWANGSDILRKMNLFDKIKAQGFMSNFQLLTDAKSKILRQTDLRELNEKYGGVVFFMKRGTLHQVLLEDKKVIDSIQFGKEITHLKENETSVTVSFSDNSTKNYDIVIGADGINSAVKNAMFQHQGNITHTSSFFYYLCQKAEDLPALTGDVEMMGNGTFLGIYPCGNNQIGVYGAVNTTEIPSDKKAYLKTVFADFEGYSDYALKTIDQVDDIFLDCLREISLKNWHSKRIILIGDAAHAMLPTTGQGISVALEDAYLLANLLKTKENKDFSSIFAEFQTIRQAPLGKIQKRARILNKLIETDNSLFCWLRNTAIRILHRGSKTKSLDTFFEETKQNV